MHAADKLERLLSVVCEDPDNIVSWKNLLLFSFCCFAVLGQRGGKRHSTLAAKMNKRISDFPKTIIFEDQKIDVMPRTAFKAKSGVEQTHGHSFKQTRKRLCSRVQSV